MRKIINAINEEDIDDSYVSEYIEHNLNALIELFTTWEINDSLDELIEPISGHSSGATTFCRIDGLIVYLIERDDTITIVEIIRDAEAKKVA